MRWRTGVTGGGIPRTSGTWGANQRSGATRHCADPRGGVRDTVPHVKEEGNPGERETCQEFSCESGEDGENDSGSESRGAS